MGSSSAASSADGAVAPRRVAPPSGRAVRRRSPWRRQRRRTRRPRAAAPRPAAATACAAPAAAARCTTAAKAARDRAPVPAYSRPRDGRTVTGDRRRPRQRASDGGGRLRARLRHWLVPDLRPVLLLRLLRPVLVRIRLPLLELLDAGLRLRVRLLRLRPVPVRRLLRPVRRSGLRAGHRRLRCGAATRASARCG